MKIWRSVTITACFVALVGSAILYGAARDGNTNNAALENELREALKTRADSALACL